MQHFPFFEIGGTPYEVGRGHGECVRDAIYRQLEECLAAAWQQGGLSREQALAWAMEQLPKIEALGGATWVDELRGLADGARIPLAGALALQVRPGTGFMPEGCTALGVSSDASAQASRWGPRTGIWSRRTATGCPCCSCGPRESRRF